MVRLKAMQSTSVGMMQVNFNSLMVRLKAICCGHSDPDRQFQFLNGSIKSRGLRDRD